MRRMRLLVTRLLVGFPEWLAWAAEVRALVTSFILVGLELKGFGSLVQIG